jgi:hypothetical protein
MSQSPNRRRQCLGCAVPDYSFRSMNRKGRPNNQLGDYLISLADACQIGRGRYLALDSSRRVRPPWASINTLELLRTKVRDGRLESWQTQRLQTEITRLALLTS